MTQVDISEESTTPQSESANELSTPGRLPQDVQSPETFLEELRKRVSDESTKCIHVPLLDVLTAFGRERRGARINREITAAFEKAGLAFDPPIENADYYGELKICRDDKHVAHTSPEESNSHESQDPNTGKGDSSNDWILSALKQDGAPLNFLVYGTDIRTVRQEFIKSGHLNMPVFYGTSAPQGSNRDALEPDKNSFIGNVSMISILDADDTDSLTQYIETDVEILSTDESLTTAIERIVRHGYVYGRSSVGEIVQIYTQHDVLMWINQISGLFWRLNEIEDEIRLLLRDFASIDEGKIGELESIARDRQGLQSIQRQDGGGRLFSDCEISSANDDTISSLTFAQYIKCFGSDLVWSSIFEQTPYSQDRDRALKLLNKIRIARNSIMHSNGGQGLEGMIAETQSLTSFLRSVKKYRMLPR